MLTSALRLVAIAGPPHVAPGRLVDACRAAEAGGATAVQLRVKGMGAGALLRHAIAIRESVHVPVFVNDRADVAAAAGASGVHVGQEDLPVDAVRAAFGDALLVGLSVGTDAEAERARIVTPDYWSIGAIYGTGTKPDAGRPIGVAGFSILRVMAPPAMPVIAIGGITADNVTAVLDAGAQGVAVIEAIFGSGGIERAAATMRRQIDAALG